MNENSTNSVYNTKNWVKKDYVVIANLLQNQKSKTEKKKEEKSVSTVHWSVTQDSKLRESVSFSNEKEILAKLYFYLKFEFQDDVQPVFKKKRNVPFTLLEQINEELDWLEKLEFYQS